jgi:replicative DNA helicase
MISEIILSSLFKDKSYAKKVLPHIKEEYFESLVKKKIFSQIKKYIITYKDLPSIDSLKYEITKDQTLSEDLFNSINETIDELSQYKSKNNIDWIVDKTEEWCKDRALHNAILESVQIIEEKKPTGSIPELVRKALQVEFDSSVGINFLDQTGVDKRWDAYQKAVSKFSTGIEPLDLIFSGGVEPKSLCLLMSATHTGKTSNMIALGANFLKNGEDVLYITLEMSEDKIAQRFDANYLGVDINDVPLMKEKTFKSRLKQIRSKVEGNLIIKEYSPATIGANKIRALIEDLKIKQDFNPKIIIIDYLNLMVSDRIKTDNLYSNGKAIAEEIRGIGVDYECCVLTATQGNREMNASDCSDVDMTNISECLSIETDINMADGSIKKLKEIKVGDKLKGNNKDVTVKKVFDTHTKDLYRIKTKSGKEIICSAEHKFPTDNKFRNVKGTLRQGTKIKTM